MLTGDRKQWGNLYRLLLVEESMQSGELNIILASELGATNTHVNQLWIPHAVCAITLFCFSDKAPKESLIARSPSETPKRPIRSAIRRPSFSSSKLSLS